MVTYDGLPRKDTETIGVSTVIGKIELKSGSNNTVTRSMINVTFKNVLTVMTKCLNYIDTEKDSKKLIREKTILFERTKEETLNKLLNTKKHESK